MATVNVVYGVETTLTWSAAIASSPTAAWQSNTIDNTSTLADDYSVSVLFSYTNAAPANDKTLYWYAGGWYGSTNGFEGRPVLSGADGAITLNDITTTPTGLRLAAAAFMVQNTTGSIAVPSLATVFGGTLPGKATFALANYSGQTIKSWTCTYRAITYTVV